MLTLTIAIKEKNIGGWYLILTNTLTDKSFEVETVSELNEQMELISSLYPQEKPEVVWLESHDVKDFYVNEVRQELLAFSEE